MKLFDARKEKYEVIQLDGITCAFTNARLDRSTIPSDLYCYEVRDTDCLEGLFAEIKPGVLVNHWGTILCKEAFPLDNQSSYIPKDIHAVFLGQSVSLKEFKELSIEHLFKQEGVIQKLE